MSDIAGCEKFIMSYFARMLADFAMPIRAFGFYL